MPEYFLKYIQEKRTQVNKALRAKLGERDSRHYRIETTGRRPKTCYELVTAPELIRV